MEYGYTVALLTVEDRAIMSAIPERVRANYKAMDANDMVVMDTWQCDRQLGVSAPHSALADNSSAYLQGL